MGERISSFRRYTFVPTCIPENGTPHAIGTSQGNALKRRINLVKEKFKFKHFKKPYQQEDENLKWEDLDGDSVSSDIDPDTNSLR